MLRRRKAAFSADVLALKLMGVGVTVIYFLCALLGQAGSPAFLSKYVWNIYTYLICIEIAYHRITKG